MSCRVSLLLRLFVHFALLSAMALFVLVPNISDSPTESMNRGLPFTLADVHDNVSTAAGSHARGARLLHRSRLHAFLACPVCHSSHGVVEPELISLFICEPVSIPGP